MSPDCRCGGAASLPGMGIAQMRWTLFRRFAGCVGGLVKRGFCPLGNLESEGITFFDRTAADAVNSISFSL